MRELPATWQNGRLPVGRGQDGALAPPSRSVALGPAAAAGRAPPGCSASTRGKGRGARAPLAGAVVKKGDHVPWPINLTTIKRTQVTSRGYK